MYHTTVYIYASGKSQNKIDALVNQNHQFKMGILKKYEIAVWPILK